MKGSYILLMELDEDKNIKIGKLGNIFFKNGYYVYVGSALNGLENRINRHLRSDKKLHWHIDYFLQHAKVIDAFYKENEIREECFIANKIGENATPINGFGCSDCNCKSHLFNGCKKFFLYMINELKMKRL